MNRRDRLHAAFKRQPVDRVPIALWRHFPGDDLHTQKFAQRVIEFQREFDFDFVKVTPAASYMAEMYGGLLRPAGNREGTREHLTRVVKDWRDWTKIGALDASNAVIQRERAAIEEIRAALGREVPILQTIFSPLSTAGTLLLSRAGIAAAGERFMQDLREHPGEFHRALEHIGTTTLRFAQESIQAGADAIFFATFMASRDVMSEADYRTFGQPYDVALLDDLRGKVDFTLLHAHGENLHFDLLAQYPVDCLNWHDRKTAPSLKVGSEKFAGALAGGIEEWNVLADGTPAEIREQIRDAVAETDGRGLIIAPGCVIPIDTPNENIRAARDAV